jgi:hypothetical protein
MRDEVGHRVDLRQQVVEGTTYREARRQQSPVGRDRRADGGHRRKRDPQRRTCPQQRHASNSPPRDLDQDDQERQRPRGLAVRQAMRRARPRKRRSSAARAPSRARSQA